MASYVLGPVARDLLQYAYNIWINSRDKASAWFTVSDELSRLPEVMSVVNDLVAHYYLVCSEDEFDRYYCLGPNGLAKVLSLRAQ